MRRCTKCRLHENRTNAVPGDGDKNADLIFIGEAPGEQEDMEGSPFVGRAGELLNELLESIDLSRDDVFITNIVKCRPPDNRDPKRDEIDTCKPYLQRQISLIDPKLICTLGNHATETLIGKKGISKIHGEEHSYRGKKVIPMYHPAAALYNPNLIEEMKEDFKILREQIDTGTDKK